MDWDRILSVTLMESVTDESALASLLGNNNDAYGIGLSNEVDLSGDNETGPEFCTKRVVVISINISLPGEFRNSNYVCSEFRHRYAFHALPEVINRGKRQIGLNVNKSQSFIRCSSEGTTRVTGIQIDSAEYFYNVKTFQNEILLLFLGFQTLSTVVPK